MPFKLIHVLNGEPFVCRGVADSEEALDPIILRVMKSEIYSVERSVLLAIGLSKGGKFKDIFPLTAAHRCALEKRAGIEA